MQREDEAEQNAHAKCKYACCIPTVAIWVQTDLLSRNVSFVVQVHLHNEFCATFSAQHGCGLKGFEIGSMKIAQRGKLVGSLLPSAAPKGIPVHSLVRWPPFPRIELPEQSNHEFGNWFGLLLVVEVAHDATDTFPYCPSHTFVFWQHPHGRHPGFAPRCRTRDTQVNNPLASRFLGTPKAGHSQN
jgi:hypothetical protein